MLRMDDTVIGFFFIHALLLCVKSDYAFIILLVILYCIYKISHISSPGAGICTSRLNRDLISIFLILTCFDEEMKGPESVKSTFLTDIGKLFDAAMTVPEIEGVILNPWNRTIMLDKQLIRIIKPENK